jgi:enoyl-CoA hydratase/carnithine racemase
LNNEDPVNRQIAEHCITLGISNIRVIKKIERQVHAIQPLLAKLDNEVFKQATQALTLFCWSHDQPGEAPTVEFLTTKKAKNVFGLSDKEAIPDNEAAWNALLEAYGYTWTDEFDLALIEGVQKGFFDPEKIEKRAKELAEKIAATKADGSFEMAWGGYHDSFENNQDEVLNAIYESFMKTFKYITPINLNGTVKLFKDLGRTEQATAMIKQYVDNRLEDRSFFDLDEYPFAGDITDSEVREAFKKKCERLQETRDLPTMLLQLRSGWNDEMLLALSTAPVEKYCRAFKQATGENLRKMLAAAIQFDRIINTSAEAKEISRRAKQALKLIGEESPINARRVARYGVIVTKKPAAVAEAVPVDNGEVKE